MIPLRDDNPTERRPVVTIIIILICSIIFLWQFFSGEKMGQRITLSLGLIPSLLFGKGNLPASLAIVPPSVTIITSMFLHGGWMHLIGNMWYLWLFGDNIEDAMGHGRYILFYIVCGVVAVLAHAIVNPDSRIPLIGASGAISGVLGGYLLLYPRAKVLVLIPLGFFITTVRLPAVIILGFWFVLQIFNSVIGGSGGGGVAWLAHIGGFIIGIILISLFKRKEVPLFGGGTGI